MIMCVHFLRVKITNFHALTLFMGYIEEKNENIQSGHRIEETFSGKMPPLPQRLNT